MPGPIPISAAPRPPSHGHSLSASSTSSSLVSTPRSTSPPPTFITSTPAHPPSPPSSSSSSPSCPAPPALAAAPARPSFLLPTSPAAAPFPAEWTCSTCSRAHSVLELLGGAVGCECGLPSLQAVYDQTGCLYLYWRDDPDVFDLRDPAKACEAAWRCWRAGGCVAWGVDAGDFERAAASLSS